MPTSAPRSLKAGSCCWYPGSASPGPGGPGLRGASVSASWSGPAPAAASSSNCSEGLGDLDQRKPTRGVRKECLNQRCANCKLESARVERRCSGVGEDRGPSSRGCHSHPPNSGHIRGLGSWRLRPLWQLRLLRRAHKHCRGHKRPRGISLVTGLRRALHTVATVDTRVTTNSNYKISK